VSSKYELERIAQNDESPDVRIAAIQQLNSNGSRYELERIAQNDLDPRVREAAVRKLRA